VKKHAAGCRGLSIEVPLDIFSRHFLSAVSLRSLPCVYLFPVCALLNTIACWVSSGL